MKISLAKRCLLFTLAALLAGPSLAAESQTAQENWQNDPLYRQGEQYEQTGSSIAIAGAALGSASLLFNNATDCDKRKDANCETKKNHRGRTGLILGIVTIGVGLIIANIGGEQKEDIEKEHGRAEAAKPGLDLGFDLTPEREASLSLALSF